MIKEKLLEIRKEIDNLIKDESIHITTLEDGLGKYELWLFPENTEDILNWWEAMEYCNKLSGSLPTIEELNYIFNYNVNTLTHSYYWSSTEISDDVSFLKNFNTGTRLSVTKTSNYHARAVKRVRL